MVWSLVNCTKTPLSRNTTCKHRPASRRSRTTHNELEPRGSVSITDPRLHMYESHLLNQLSRSDALLLQALWQHHRQQLFSFRAQRTPARTAYMSGERLRGLGQCKGVAPSRECGTLEQKNVICRVSRKSTIKGTNHLLKAVKNASTCFPSHGGKQGRIWSKKLEGYSSHIRWSMIEVKHTSAFPSSNYTTCRKVMQSWNAHPSRRLHFSGQAGHG